jgi:alkylhydroperoxidase family enzyme
MTYVWAEMAPGIAGPAGAYSYAVYHDSALSLREFEAARYTIARINDCTICTNWRTARDVPERGFDPDEVSEDFYAQLDADPTGGDLSERERLAAEFARRYAVDHLSMDDEFWARCHAAYSDQELVDLALCVASWLGLGRFNRVFDIDGACRVPAPPAAVAAAHAG